VNISDKIEKIVAEQYGCKWEPAMKNIGDFYISENEAVNVKSSNIAKNNFAPNMVSAMKVYDYLRSGNLLYFIFVDYKLKDNNEIDIVYISDLVPINYIDWSCLKIQTQGTGVIQMTHKNFHYNPQSEETWIDGLKTAYKTYIGREREKMLRLEKSLGLEK
jgi:hypothetical protein